MRTLVFNESNLQENEMGGTITRVKVFLMNSQNEIFYAISNGGIQLPGGHVENGEEYIDTVKREVKEELGIVLENKEISNPFFEIKHYTKNYRGSEKNIISNMIYYVVRTDKETNLEKSSLTENEKKNEFTVNKINCKMFEEQLKIYIEKEKSEINKVIEEEILIAFEELKKLFIE